MWRFVVDEDMPRSTAVVLRQAGHAADDVRDVGLRSRPDPEILAYAQAHGAVLVTADLDFSDLLYETPQVHSGVVIVRLPNALPTRAVNAELLRALEELAGQNLADTLVIVELGRTRIRRPPRPIR
jgi:predicted nuclease of predicted toxin-antitoxin system